MNDEWGWFKDGNEKTDGKNEGEIRKGIPNGQGTFTFLDGRKYVGEFKDGKPLERERTRQKREHHTKVDEWSETKMKPHKTYLIISCVILSPDYFFNNKILVK